MSLIFILENKFRNIKTRLFALGSENCSRNPNTLVLNLNSTITPLLVYYGFPTFFPFEGEENVPLFNQTLSLS